METITIKKSENRSLPVKLYAKVPSRSRHGVNHTVTFIRSKGMERWTCSCEDQVITQTPKRRHCFHIKAVRKQTALNGQVGKRPILAVIGGDN